MAGPKFDPQNPCKKLVVVGYIYSTFVIPVLGRWRKANSWGSLTSHNSQFSKHRLVKDPVSNKNKNPQGEGRAVARRQSTCLLCMRPWVQCTVPKS